MTTIATQFDYNGIGPDRKNLIVTLTNEIRDRMGRAAQNVVEIGTRLIAVKKQLRHGEFGDWLQAEFGWDDRTARRMMNVADTFKSDKLSDLNIAPSALYLLASPSTPEDVRTEFIEKAKAGEPVTHADVKAAIEPAMPRTLASEIGEDADDKPTTEYFNADTGEAIENLGTVKTAVKQAAAPKPFAFLDNYPEVKACLSDLEKMAASPSTHLSNVRLGQAVNALKAALKVVLR